MQDKISAYLNDLISIGVSGFRIDAAKHIPAEDLSEIFAKLSKPVYITMVRCGSFGAKCKPDCILTQEAARDAGDAVSYVPYTREG